MCASTYARICCTLFKSPFIDANISFRVALLAHLSEDFLSFNALSKSRVDPRSYEKQTQKKSATDEHERYELCVAVCDEVKVDGERAHWGRTIHVRTYAAFVSHLVCFACVLCSRDETLKSKQTGNALLKLFCFTCVRSHTLNDCVLCSLSLNNKRCEAKRTQAVVKVSVRAKT